MDFRLTLAIAVGKIISWATKMKGGAATAAPGLYALKIEPQLIQKLSKNIKYASVVVSGTNGKTTTSRLIASILGQKYKIIHNRQGSNLTRGLASTLISQKTNADIAVWEADEAALPEILNNTKPKVVVLLNLFRDQLDRYGEINTVRNKWQMALSELPKSTVLIANSDDPNIALAAMSFRGKKIFFGTEDNRIALPSVENVQDIKFCPICNRKLNYSVLFSAHLGKYFCPSEDLKRPTPYVSAKSLNFRPDFSTSFSLNLGKEKVDISYKLPGLYNSYNILAAAAAARSLGIPLGDVVKNIQTFTPAFGRFQRLSVNGKNIAIFLIKNPAGANEVLRLLATKNNLNILAILNDNIADGRDVSWIWDTNWEVLNGKVKQISTAGTRSYDIALRLKYAGFNLEKTGIFEDVESAISKNIEKMQNKDTLIILPTYTALLSVQKSLTKLGGNVKWQNQ